MPPAAIFQNWLGLLVTNASLTIFAAPPPPRLQPIAAAIAIAIMTSEKPNLLNVVFFTADLLGSCSSQKPQPSQASNARGRRCGRILSVIWLFAQRVREEGRFFVHTQKGDKRGKLPSKRKWIDIFG